MFEESRDGSQNNQGAINASTSPVIANSPTPTNIDQALAPEKEQVSLVTSITPVEQAQQAIIAHFIPYLNRTLPASSKIPETDQKLSREAFIQALREDRIPTEEENKFLLTFPPKVNESAQVFDQIITDMHEKQILAIVCGYNSQNWQDVTSDDLKAFISAPRHHQPDYRTPVGFADLRRRFLSEIQNMASPDQFDDYIRAMDRLEQKLYGDRFDYYRQFELMRKDAQAIGQDLTATLTDETNPNDIGPIDQVSTLVKTPIGSVNLTLVEDELRNQLLNRATVEGDPWVQGGQSYHLSVPNLVTAGLYPTFEITVDNQVIYLSNLFELTSDQMAAIAFIPTNNGVKVRSYYRDKDNAIWRYLPDYIRDISGEGIDVFGVGFNQRSTVLPILLQSGLNQIERRGGIIDLSNTNPDFLFAGTAPAYATRQEFRDTYSRGQLRGDFYREVSHQPFNADSNSIIAPGRKKVAPQLLSVNREAGPDFENLMVRYSVYSAFTGQIMGEGYESVDTQTAWLFFSDYRGRCWVANIELNVHVTSTGCRQEWLLATDISTPLYEAARLTDGYGDTSDSRANNHLGMWENYLSKVPLMQEYEAIISQRK